MMKRFIGIGASIAAVDITATPTAALQDVALKDLMPKSMVTGVAIDQTSAWIEMLVNQNRDDLRTEIEP